LAAIVQEGQVMFEMERKPFEARLDAAKADLGQEDARLANAQQTLERVQGLSEKMSLVARTSMTPPTRNGRQQRRSKLLKPRSQNQRQMEVGGSAWGSNPHFLGTRKWHLSPMHSGWYRSPLW
jgi:multidrug resistance efflux pump